MAICGVSRKEFFRLLHESKVIRSIWVGEGGVQRAIYLRGFNSIII